MEDQKDTLSMLELMLQPAFFVRDGMITLVNRAAQQFLLEPGVPIEPLLGSSLEEYDQFSEGCLYPLPSPVSAMRICLSWSRKRIRRN